MKLKKAGAVIMTAVMAAGILAGCSGGSESAGTNTAQTTAAGNTTAAQTEAAALSGSGEVIVINVWSKDRHDATYVQEKIDEYNATNTNNIQINYQLYTDNYVQAVDMAVQSDEMPDILVYQEQVFDKYVSAGQWADLNPYLDDDMRSLLGSSIFPGYNELDGKLYFIPTTGTTCRLFYNKEIFERVGIGDLGGDGRGRETDYQ